MKNKIIIIISLIVLVIIVFVGGILFDKIIFNSNNITAVPEKSIVKDSKRFKEEYEKLNGTLREKDGENYCTVNINEDNPIVYVGLEEFVNIINSDEEALIYISSPTCPYCRTTLETLLKALKDLGVEKLYYYNSSSNNNNLDVAKKDELTNQLVEMGILNKDDEGSIHWSLPYIAKTESGVIIAEKVGTNIDYNEGQTKNSPLTEEQKEKLYNEYYELFK